MERSAAAAVLDRAEPSQESAPVAWDRQTILFSACNEDNRCELRAFGPLQGQRVLCVTAGGGRVLNLVAQRPAEILAVDLNPAQNALLELKIAGMRELDHAGYLEFLGARPGQDRMRTYERLRSRLSAPAQAFFDASPDVIELGALLQGKLERFFGRLAVVMRVAHPLGIKRLFAFEELEPQRRFLNGFSMAAWRVLARNLSRRWIMEAFSGDPGFYRYVPEHVALHEAIYNRVFGHFSNHLARENPLMQIIFFGRYTYEPALPIYLNAATYAQTKAALDHVRIETITATVDEALAHGSAGGFDAFSISDISSYLDDEAHARLFEHVLSVARPGARLCSRSNIYHRPLAPEHERRVQRDLALERQFSIDDHSCVHEFVVGKIE
jgi:S-adenosylmethionine-diacylglycerol 3-amino-3-carboxypropyl transferase